MKVLILAGGFGTRLSELTGTIPKPMVPIGGKPILWHIMKHFAFYGHNKFYIALGYKSEIIKEYFLKYRELNSNFSINLGSGEIKFHNQDKVSWSVTLVDTGLNSMTGGRVKRLENFIGNERFFLTYGDGVSNVDLKKLERFHLNHKKISTVTSVRPSARFGEIDIENNKVTSFAEKPQTKKGWINGGFFIMEPKFFEYINNDMTILEREPLENVAKENELMAFKHSGFWQCMDTKRDQEYLENLWNNGNPPWFNYN